MDSVYFDEHFHPIESTPERSRQHERIWEDGRGRTLMGNVTKFWIVWLMWSGWLYKILIVIAQECKEEQVIKKISGNWKTSNQDCALCFVFILKIIWRDRERTKEVQHAPDFEAFLWLHPLEGPWELFRGQGRMKLGKCKCKHYFLYSGPKEPDESKLQLGKL